MTFITQKEIWINSPPQKVFELHADHANRVKWHDHVTHSTMITPPPLGVGSQFQLAVITVGRATPLTIEIIAYEPYRYYAYRSFTSIAKTDSHQTFLAENGGTRFQVRIELQVHGLARLFGWFIFRFSLLRHFDEALRELKTEMEKDDQQKE